ncbi:hypothetical protein EDB80DRAFT_825957 [Ilyonectria destructans]|nr:hypothetical protein EDB80DRAFT_825957 [Ilyonectria destructans]
MGRSVSVELLNIPAGSYIVYLKVTGERDLSLKSVEDIVKYKCSERVENQKLAQVGYAYDLAYFLPALFKELNPARGACGFDYFSRGDTIVWTGDPSMTLNRPNVNQAQKLYVDLIYNMLLASFKSLSGGICHWELRGAINDGKTAH